jgi:hypothetical protein
MTTTICLHMGHAKTGTSAIQIALARNRDLFAKHGVVYPKSHSDKRAEKGLITSGNGDLLKTLLGPDGRPHQEAQAKTLLRDLIETNNERVLLFSSELLTASDPERFAALCEFVRVCGAEIKIIYYVRHLMDVALSIYSQAVKRSVECRSFEDWVGQYRNSYVRVLTMIAGTAGKANCTVRLFEEQKDNLVENFVKLIPGGNSVLEDQVTTFANDRKTVNRSLTNDETAIMLFVNDHLKNSERKFAKILAGKISDQLLHNRGTAVQPAIVTDHEFRILTEINSQVPAFVNAFVAGEFELKFKSDEITIGRRPIPSTGPNDATFRSIVDILIKQQIRQATPS